MRAPETEHLVRSAPDPPARPAHELDRGVDALHLGQRLRPIGHAEFVAQRAQTVRGADEPVGVQPSEIELDLPEVRCFRLDLSGFRLAPAPASCQPEHRPEQG